MATIITNVIELQAMKDDLAEYYILDRNIDAAATQGWNGGLGFEPIGTTPNPFTGAFNMAGYTISNLYINRPADAVGLFDKLVGGIIINGVLANVDIIGINGAPLVYKATNATIIGISTSGIVRPRNYAAGLVSLAYSGTEIENCNSSCIISSTSGGDAITYSGGLVAEAQGALITKSHATGNVTGYAEAWAGALVGFLNNASTISESFATGNVIGYDYGAFVGGMLGGLVGIMGNGSLISNAYARGNISVETPASAYIGGHTGWIDNALDSIINSYSTGNVPVLGTVGGLVGYRKAGSTLTACFWDITTSGTIDGVGDGAETGATGAITYLMKLQSTFTGAAWDFDTIWSINGVTNDGYPFHLAILPDDLPDSPRRTSEEPIQDKISLELIRNVEMASGGHFRTDEEGNAVYKSRYARNP